jgi:molybdate transport system substrate-binding protein
MQEMRKTRVVILAAIMAIFCFAATANAMTDLTVFAAASMTESMNRIAELYKKVAPDVNIVYNFDSSGTLKTQIEQGAECDLFISAGQKQMNQIDIEADPKLNKKKLDFVMPGTRFNIVSNKVVLIIPKGTNEKRINSFKDVLTDKVKLVSLGNSDVPVGQYSEEIYRSLGIWDELNASGKLSFASNVKEVLAQVAAGAVDCGAVYSTDAATNNKVMVVAVAPKNTHRPITYPAAIMKNAKNKEAAAAFAKYLQGPEAVKVFKSIGFAIPER